MKKCNALRKRLLTLLGISAMVLAGSCSKDAAVEPDKTDAALQTRATPEFSFYCEPAAKGTDESYLALKETYRFSCFSFVTLPPPLGTPMVPCELTVHASDGSTDGFEFVDGEPSGNFEQPIYVKFTKPGYYHLTAETELDGACYQKTWTYCVVSNARRIVLPDSIRLGVPFDLSFVFSDPRYPAPTIEISETLFNDPQCTVLDNDDHGNFRLRFDQPGEYSISTGLGGKFSASANIKLYWRPEKVTSVSVELPLVFPDGNTRYKNEIYLCDANNMLYTSIPYRAYFSYETRQIVSQGQEVEELSGVQFCDAGSGGVVDMPNTKKEIAFTSGNWFTSFGNKLKFHWELTIPEDDASWFCAVNPDVIIDPENPGGGTRPLDPPGGGTIIK